MSGVKASAVSRFLGANNEPRSEYHPSAQVRGWGQTSSGFRCEQSYAENGDEIVRVSWMPGDGYRSTSVREKQKLVSEKIAALRELLSARYKVAMECPDYVFGGDPFLIVSEKEADGNGSN